MKNKVCILTTVHSVFDTRIFHKEAKTLTQAGYDITLIAQYNRNEIVDGVKIIALPKPRNRFMRIFGLTWWAFFLALRQNVDFYHLHDPELIMVGVILKFFGKKIIYDVHEDVPKQILDKDWIGNLFVKKFFAFLVNLIEQTGAFLFNRIVAATPEIAKKFPKNKTIILRNFPILKLINNAISVDYKKNKPLIIYAGGLSKIRGIKEVIQAMEYIGDRAELLLLGKWESEKFKKECENLRGWKYTKYLGFKKLEEVYGYMRISDIGLSMLYPTKNYSVGLPIKSFEYMACSLPIVMSNFSYWQKIFKEYGLFANPYDSKDIAKKILFLLNNSTQAKRLREKGKQLVEEEYHWEEENKKLLKMYKDL